MIEPKPGKPPHARFVVLDSWRGICALFVATHNLNFGPWLPQAPFVAHSFLFVDFFFVLSGFVISHAYMDRLSRVSDVAAFMLRRVGRLWPMHAATLTALIGLMSLKYLAGLLVHADLTHQLAEGDHSVRTIVTNLLLVQTFDPPSRLSWNAPSWSISTELWTYLLFSAACLLGGPRRTVIVGCAAILAAMAVVLISPSFLENNTNAAFFRCIYGFAVGHLCYRIWQVRPFRNVRPFELPALTLVMLFVYFSGGGFLSMAAPLVFGLAVLVFAQEQGTVSAVLIKKPFVQLGAWSYSIYMVHWIFRDILVGSNAIIETLIARGIIPTFTSMTHAWTLSAALIVYLASTVAVSAVTYRFIEQPCRTFFNRAISSRASGLTIQSAQSHPQAGS